MDFGWNVSNVVNCDTVCYGISEETVPWLGLVKGERGPRPITHAMALATLFVGMSEITQENHREFFARLRFRESAFGTLLSRDGKARSIDFSEVVAFIGLTTNAPDLGREAWLKLWTTELLKHMAWKADQLPEAPPPNDGIDRPEFEMFRVLAKEALWSA